MCGKQATLIYSRKSLWKVRRKSWILFYLGKSGEFGVKKLQSITLSSIETTVYDVLRASGLMQISSNQGADQEFIWSKPILYVGMLPYDLLTEAICFRRLIFYKRHKN